MVKAHWKLEALIPTVVGVFETDTNPAHFYSKHLHIWFPFVVVLINIPLIHMTCCWFTGTMNAGTLIRMHVFAERKTAHQPQLKRATEQQSAQSSESWLSLYSDNHPVQTPVPGQVSAHFHRKALRSAASVLWWIWLSSGVRQGVEHRYFWSGDSLGRGSVSWIWSDLSVQTGSGEFVALANALFKSGST